MYNSDSKGISYSGGFFMLIAFVIGGAFVAQAISNAVWTGMTGKTTKELFDGSITAADATAMRVIQVINAVFSFLLPTFIVAYLLHRRPFRLIGFESRGMQIKQFGLIILIFGAALMLSTALSYVTHLIPLSPSNLAYFDGLEERYNKTISVIVNPQTAIDYIIALVVMCFFPALCEEVVFRGGLQNFLTRGTNKPWMAIIIVSAIFSIMHFSYYGFLSRFALGVVLGALYYYSGTIWWSVIAHFLNNAMAVTILYIYALQGKPISEAMTQEVENYWGLVAIIPLIGLLIMFKNSAAKNKRRLE